jgi:predicted PurR-regulated permease PerM
MVITVLLLVLAGYLLKQFSEAIPPVVLSVILAYVLTPLVNFLDSRLRFPRVLAVIVVYLLAALLVAALLMVIVPFLVGQFGRIELNLQDILDQISDLAANQFYIGDFVIDGQEVVNEVINALRDIFQPVVGHTIDVVTTVLSSLVWIIFIVIVSFYLVKDSQKLSDWMEGLVPPAYHSDYVVLRDEISTIWGAFFRGQLLLALIVTVLITTVSMIIGLPYPLIMGIFAGLMEFIPSVGHGIWFVVVSILSLIFGSSWIPVPNWAFWLIVIFVHLLYKQFDLNYLIPRIIGPSGHLPPVVVILGIVAGASFAGVLGVVLAAPVIASARVLMRYIYALLFDLEPFPKMSTSPLPPPEIRWWRKYRERLAASEKSETKKY